MKMLPVGQTTDWRQGMLQIEDGVAPIDANQKKANQYPGFRCNLCSTPIYYRLRWHRDLLIQAALDPGIDGIEPAAAPTDRFSFGIRRGDHRAVVVALDHGHSPPETTAVLLPIIVVTRETVLSGPVAGAARAVWATRNYLVSARDRIAILASFEKLEDQRLRELARLARDPSEGVDAVLSLVCEGKLSIRLRDGLSPDMKVQWRGSRSGFQAAVGP